MKTILLSACIALLCVCTQVAGVRAPPAPGQTAASVLAPSWRATVHGGSLVTHGFQVGHTVLEFPLEKIAQGEIFYDAHNSRSTYALKIERTNASFVLIKQQVDQKTYSVFSGVCTVPPTSNSFQPYWSQFVYNRTVVEDGRVVDIFMNRNSPVYPSLVVLDRETALPVRMEKATFTEFATSFNGTGSSIELALWTSYDMTGRFNASVVSAWPTNPSSSPFTPPPVCLTSTGLVCPTESSVIANISMVRLHDASNYSLANHNTVRIETTRARAHVLIMDHMCVCATQGDLTGDVQYLCSRFTPATFHVNDTSLGTLEHQIEPT